MKTSVFTFVFAASLLLLAQQKPTTPASAPPPGMQSQTQSAKVKDAPQQPPTRKASRTPKRQAWQMLTNAAAGNKTSGRAIAIRVLGLMPNDAKALRLAEKALSDDKSEVRSAAAAALGDMKARSSIPKLREVLDDQEPSVALAAAHALILMHDDDAYEVYYEVLNGQRKSGKGLIATQASILHDPKKMAELGFEEGIGFVPFAGIGWAAIKVIKKDDSSPVRAAAAKVLARDPDPATTIALVDAAGDKSWLVQAAALEALATRGDPSVIDTVKAYMSDENPIVKYTAAATFLRLTAIQEKNRNLNTLRNKR
jgi:HEAT repeat protein